ncbi:hypothetical protein MCEREM21A_00498 [Sphingomonadaceae bacterium]
MKSCRTQATEVKDNPFLDDGPDIASRLADVPAIRAMLQQAAREQRAMSYSEMLMMLGFRFTRPKMRALCRTLDRIDAEAALCGAPALACLVVREGDGLPGQGWWVGREDYKGVWEGAEARAYLAGHQQRAFDYWSAR